MVRYVVDNWTGDGRTNIFLYRKDRGWETFAPMVTGFWKDTKERDDIIRAGEVFPDLVVEVMDKCT